MKSATKKILLYTAALAVMAVAWWSWTRDGESPESEATITKPKAAAVERSFLPLADKTEEKPLPDWGTPEFSKTILERCAKWLESRGRDGASLIAMWDLAGDEALLLEAAEKFPDDPRVCAAMIGHLTKNGEDALPWVERLIKNESKNPAGYYWKATLLAKAGKPEEALEALRTGTEVKGTPDQHLRERMVTAREAALAGGGSIKGAALVALAGPFSRMGHPMLAGEIMSTLRSEIDEAKNAGDTDRVVEMAGLGAAAAEHLRHTDARTLVDDLVSMGMLQAMLENLPQETEYGSSEKTAGDRLAEFETERDEIEKLSRSAPRMKFMALTDSQAAEYTDRLILHGEAAAQRWLIDLTRESEAPQN